MEKDYNVFEIACNMNKCKYSILEERTINNNPSCFYTSIFISIETIIKDYITILGDNDDPTLTSEKIASEILEIACHYKRFYKSHDNQTHTVYIFLYNGLGYEKYINPFKLSNNEINNNLKEKIKTACFLLNTVCKYIPNIYYIDMNGLPGALLPYQIICAINENKLFKGKIQRNIIVSSNSFDYTILGFQSTHINSARIFIYRRKNNNIFTTDNIYTNFVFKDRKTKDVKNGYFLYFYPRIIMCYPNLSKIIGINENILKLYRSIILKNQFKYLNEENIEIWKKEIDLFESENTVIKEVNKYFNIPNIYIKNIEELIRMKTMWCSDCLDFSIEDLNSHYFIHNKVDFASLF